MSEEVFMALLEWFKWFNPWPGNPEDQIIIREFLAEEAKDRGFESLGDALEGKE